MTTISSTTTAVQTPFDDAVFDEAQLAAASFLARYSGRTLEAYRQDLRGFFQWAADHDIPVLAATRPHIELWRGAMEERGLAASTIDRRLSTVCGFYRFAHIDGRIGSNPAESTSAAPRSTPRMLVVLTVPSSACSSPPPTATTVRTRHLRSCSG
jgi:site-specific recombinase XerD